MSIPCKKVWVVLVAGLSMIGVWTCAPNVLVVNSVPGEIPLSDTDRAELLQTHEDRIGAFSTAKRSAVLRRLAGRDVDGLTRDERSGVVALSQIVLARMSVGDGIERCNELLQELNVYGRAGSSWSLHKRGDYDFALIWLTAILYKFGDDAAVLYPETRTYLLNTLLTEEGGLDRYVPRTGGMVFDTENHLLMREGSRYLKNQWLKSKGSTAKAHDNRRNGLEEWFVQHLNDLRLNGVYEYNSTPYAVYTLLPLMNLADYAESQTIRRLAESVIDNVLTRYAYGSRSLRQCAPFRRQFKFAESPSLRLNRLSDLVRFQMDESATGDALLVFASILHDYRLPKRLADRFAGRIEDEYFAVFAHKAKGGAEIYSGGPGYLLSAGGAYRGEWASVIARPIALLLDDAAEELGDCIHIQGPGGWKEWNMSGVHRRFAVARGTVHVPAGFGHVASLGWNVLKASDEITVAYYQGTGLAMLIVLPDPDILPDDALRMLEAENPAPEKTNLFVWPTRLAPAGIRSISFDVDAAPASWVITSVNGDQPAPMATRTFEEWPFWRID